MSQFIDSLTEDSITHVANHLMRNSIFKNTIKVYQLKNYLMLILYKKYSTWGVSQDKYGTWLCTSLMLHFSLGMLLVFFHAALEKCFNAYM